MANDGVVQLLKDISELNRTIAQHEKELADKYEELSLYFYSDVPDGDISDEGYEEDDDEDDDDLDD